jgi:Ca-activated chloride channel family protein
MNWYYQVGQWEYLLGAAFIAAYILYIIRVVGAAQRMGIFASVILAKFIIRTLYFVLLIIALAGPSFGKETREVRTSGRDVFLVLDLSQSMNATDLPPSRLGRARYEAGRLLDRFPDDRIGLILFSSEAVVQCPLTFDQNALRLFLASLRTGLLSGGGTNLAAGLRLALEKHTDPRNTTLKNTSKAIILFTDGEDFGEDFREIARTIAGSGIKLFIIGIGSEGGSKIPTGKTFKQVSPGKAVVTRLEREQLVRLSRQAEGEFFEVTPVQNEMNRLFGQLQKVQGQIRDTRQIDVSANKYYYFLLAALVLMALDVTIAVNTIRF